MISVREAKDANWACAALSIFILLTRLAVYRCNQNTFDASVILCLASILVISSRIAVNYYRFRTGSASDALSENPSYFAPDNYAAIKTGSILVLVGRLLITTYYWFQSCLLLLFYSRIMPQFRWITNTIRLCWFTIVASYI